MLLAGTKQEPYHPHCCTIWEYRVDCDDPRLAQQLASDPLKIRPHHVQIREMDEIDQILYAELPVLSPAVPIRSRC
jgi:hypothetical protein